MDFPVKSFSEFLRDMATAVGSFSGRLINFSPGSVVRSLLEANASVGTWLQWQMLEVMRSTRAATSNADDLDSWMMDFGIKRLAAKPSSGVVTISRLSSSVRCVVPTGMMLKAMTGSPSFRVIDDPSHPCWMPADAGYLLEAGVGQVTVPIVCQEPGSIGNVQAGTISMIASAVPGIDHVFNPEALANGMDQEDDDALRARFKGFLLSRSRATTFAIQYAIAELGLGVKFSIAENKDPSGSLRLGHISIVVDENGATVSSGLFDTIIAAVEAVRPIGSTFSVTPAGVDLANIQLTLVVRSDSSAIDIRSQAAAAISSYVASLGIGEPLAITRVAEVCYRCDDRIRNVTSLSINGLPNDLIGSPGRIIKTSSVIVH